MDTNEAKRVLNGSSIVTEVQREAFDVNKDSFVNAIDINIIVRYIIGFITSLD